MIEYGGVSGELDTGVPNYPLRSGFQKGSFAIVLGSFCFLLYVIDWAIPNLANFANSYSAAPELYYINFYTGVIMFLVVPCILLLYLMIPLYSQLNTSNNFLKITPEGLEYYDAPILFDCLLPLPKKGFIPFISIAKVNLHQGPGGFNLK